MLPRLFTCSLTLYWLLSLVTVLFVAANGATTDTIVQAATALSGWATWIYWGFLGLLLFHSAQQTESVIKIIALAGLLTGGIILLQWLVGDYSYFLGSLDGISSPFYRVRGTSYYHAPAALVTALGALAFIGLMRGRLEIWPTAGAAFLVAVTVLNNTRAVSLALIIGLLCLAGLIAVRRRWGAPVFALIAAVVVMSNVMYLKPAPSIEALQTKISHQTKLSPESPIVGTEQPATTANISAVNAPRVSLAYAGLGLLPKHLLLGSGPGILNLPLEGGILGGGTNTYSTHILFLDLLLMGGGPAFLFFMLAIVAALISGLRPSLVYNPNRSLAVPVILALLVAFAVASVFLPQERNEIIGVAFACAGLLLRGQKQAANLQTTQMDAKLPKGFLAAGTAAACGWAMLTSPVYVFPAIELNLYHGNEIVRERQMVFVTEPATQPILQALLKLRGAQSTQVSVLQDDSYTLEHDNFWILWSPTRENDYPELIAALEDQNFPRHPYPLGIGTPDHWWLMDSAEPVISFLFAGIRSPLAGNMRIHPNLAPYLNIRASNSIVGNPIYIADRDQTTVISWPSENRVFIEFTSNSNQLQGHLSLYQLNAFNYRSTPKTTLYSWRLNGANENNEWTVIDEIVDYAVSQDPAFPSLFSVKSDNVFKKYRLEFTPANDSKSSLYSGLSEITLHFSPNRSNKTRSTNHAE